MLCLSEEETEKFKEYQIQCSQLEQKHAESLVECNQNSIDALRSNPFIDINQLKLTEEYSKVFENQKKVIGDYNNLAIKYNQVSDQYSELKLFSTLMGIVLSITYLIIFIKWLIKVERKMSKRDEPKPIKFTKRTNPKKGDRP